MQPPRGFAAFLRTQRRSAYDRERLDRGGQLRHRRSGERLVGGQGEVERVADTRLVPDDPPALHVAPAVSLDPDGKPPLHRCELGRAPQRLREPGKLAVEGDQLLGTEVAADGPAKPAGLDFDRGGHPVAVPIIGSVRVRTADECDGQEPTPLTPVAVRVIGQVAADPSFVT